MNIRQVVVLVSTIGAIVGSLVGSGALGGTPIAQSAGGIHGMGETAVRMPHPSPRLFPHSRSGV